MTTLYLVRHGETEWNVEGRTQGQMNSDLTPEGILQAESLAQALRNVPIAAVYASDLTRAHDTAQILARERALAVKTTQALRERSFGVLEGTLHAEMREELDVLWGAHNALPEEERRDHAVVEGAETENQMMARFITFLREVAIAHEGESVLIVSHGAIIRTLLIHLGHFTVHDLKVGSLKNTGYIILKSDGIDFFVEKIEGLNPKETRA